MNNKTVIIPGMANKLLAFSVRFMSRKFVALPKLSTCAQMGAEVIEVKKCFESDTFSLDNKFEQISKKI